MSEHKDNNHESHAHHHGHKQWTVEEMTQKFNDPSRNERQKPYDVIALFGDLNEKIILDLGAGAGYFTCKLAEKNARVIAADIQQDYLDHIVKTATSLDLQEWISTRLISSDSPSLENEEVDGILSVDVCHHIDNRITYLKQLHAGLRKNGKLIIVEHAPDKCIDRGPPVAMRISSDSLGDEIQKAGFSHLEVNDQLLECQYILIAGK